MPRKKKRETRPSGSGLELRSYRCDRCGEIHLTSRTKGKRVPRPVSSLTTAFEPPHAAG